MKFITLIFISLLSWNVFSQQQIAPKLYDVNGNSFYLIQNDSNTKALIFLHGGVNNPYFDQDVSQIQFDFITENNQALINQSSTKGFDLFVPISNDSLNWLENPQSSFKILKKMIEQSNKEYKEIYISGFSDGGTGSYKIFYTHPDFFNGLIVFNGYPQHSNFYKSVSYNTITDKKVLFWGTDNDKVIPYEFLLTEYCQQKKTNANTFFYLAKGDHSFSSYKEDDIVEVFDILTDKNKNSDTQPIQGFIKNDALVERYPFRKKIVKTYGFGEDIYKENLRQQKGE